MAGLLRSHGIMAVLALSLVVAAEAAEPGHRVVGGTQNREELDACDHGNPIRMPMDGLKELALDGAESWMGGLKPDDAHVLPHPDTAKKVADMAVPRSEQAAAPSDGPSACGSTSLAVSLLVFIGMALLGLVVA